MRFPAILVGAGAVSVIALLATTAAAQSAATGAASAADPGQGSLVEDYEHPNQEGAAAIGMTLKKGNGKIFWVDCAHGGDLLTVESDSIKAPNSTACFTITGPDGYLALEIPSTYFIKGDRHKVTATLTAQVEGKEVKREYAIKPGVVTPVGETKHPQEGPAALVELRSQA